MKHKIELIVFDIAGTTVKDNGSVAQALQKALLQYGYSVPEPEITLLMGYRKNQAIEILLNIHEPDKDKITLGLIDDIHSSFLQIMVDYYETTNDLTPAPGAEEVFAFLKEKSIIVALNTGFSKIITMTIMNRLGWLQGGLVDYTVSSDEVVSGRPFPYMIQNIMQQAKIRDAKNVIKVGDTEVDIHEGKNAGCLYSIGITTGAFTRKQLKIHEPSFIIDELKELLPVISQN
jgi:phosphonatase-like hydrolase